MDDDDRDRPNNARVYMGSKRLAKFAHKLMRKRTKD